MRIRKPNWPYWEWHIFAPRYSLLEIAGFGPFCAAVSAHSWIGAALSFVGWVGICAAVNHRADKRPSGVVRRAADTIRQMGR